MRRALEGAPIRVGTENAAKLGAVRGAFAAFAADPAALDIVPVGVESGVPEQPLGWSQIVAGARHRARAALASGGAALGVGIEDGLVRLTDDACPPGSAGSAAEDLDAWFNVGCAWVTDGEREARGFSSGFAYPPGALGTAVRDQAPIGDLFDALWSGARPPVARAARPADRAPSGRAGGNIGRLTGGRLERAGYGEQAVVCALVRFLHGDLYD